MKSLFILFLFACLSVNTVAANPWLDDWLDQMTVTSPGYLDGQRRGYLTGGAFQARWRMTNDQAFSVQAPKIKAGCGGIDVFAGGLSFLDPDLLVDKLQGIVQAAPAVAFDMALKTMCKECSETMKAMERAASWLNGLQLNDCALSKRLVTTVAADDKDMVAEMWNEISGGVSLNQALHRNFDEHKAEVKAAGGRPPVPMDQAIRDCPVEFKNIFSRGGSVIANITQQMGLTAYGDLMRGYLGDVLVSYVPANNAYHMETVAPCPGNDAKKLDDLLTGEAQERPEAQGALCVNNSATSLNQWMEDRLLSIGNKIKHNGPDFTLEEQAFMNASPLPVYQFLLTGVKTGTENSTIAIMRAPLALAYAYRAFDDLYKQTSQVVDKALEVANLPGTIPGGDRDFCHPKVLEGAIAKVRRWKPRLATFRKATKQHYDSEISALSDHFNVIRFELEKKIAAQQQDAQGLLGQ